MNNPDHKQSGIVFVTVLIVTAAIVLVGGTAYYLTDGFGTKKDKDTKTSKTLDGDQSLAKNDNVKEDQVNKSATGADTLPLVKAAVAGNGSIKCVSKAKIDGKYALTTMYIKDKDNIKMDIRTDMGTLNTLFKDQDRSYTWSEGQDRGTIFGLTKDDRTIDQQWQENLNDAKKSELKGISCQRTSVNNSLFAVPSNVKFSDARQFIN